MLQIRANRHSLRDFTEADRAAFVAYQTDPRYLALYDLDAEPTRAHELFELFCSWQAQNPRVNYQFGIFSQREDLLGCAGLRLGPAGTAEAGIELAPDNWGRYRLALDAIEALLHFGFNTLELAEISGWTSSGNSRIARLATRFGAVINERRDGPEWMKKRGWSEVRWRLQRPWDWSTTTPMNLV
jgi:ribosomal-protein-alanine N-acetyltransferase